MLKCRDIGHQASDYTDGSLSWRQSVGYGFHLLLCGHCRTFVRHLRLTITCARDSAKRTSLSEDEVQRIVDKAVAGQKNPH